MSRISITIPTWNEEAVIGHNLRILLSALPRLLPEHDVAVEIADNASTDRTREIVREFPVSLHEIPTRGKGRAVRESWSRHLDDADILVFMDADLAADLFSLPALVNPILSGAADIVCGSRFVAGAKVTRSPSRRLASMLYRVFQKILLRLSVKDAQCGFKAISVSSAKILLPRCKENGWLFDTALLAHAKASGCRIAEIPVTWVDARDPARRSAIRLFRHGWGFLSGLIRIRKRVSSVE